MRETKVPGRDFGVRGEYRTVTPIPKLYPGVVVVQPGQDASVEIDAAWEHLGEQRLRRIAKVICSESAEQSPLDLTVEGATVFYRDKPYRFPRGIEVLIPVITSDVEQFLTFASRLAHSLRT